MSWAEVKKINSDMSVPLDELIKGVALELSTRKTEIIYGVKSGGDSTEVIIERTGKGVLRGIYMVGNETISGDNFRYTRAVAVEVDGNVLCNPHHTFALNASYAALCRIGSASNLLTLTNFANTTFNGVFSLYSGFSNLDFYFTEYCKIKFSRALSTITGGQSTWTVTIDSLQ